MGRRYAYANDLSMVLTDMLRQSQFLPFVSYYIRSKSSEKVFDIQGRHIEPGSLLWQFHLNKTEAQKFSFEDTGEGLFYIRTHRGNNYLTVIDHSHEVDPNPTGSGGAFEGIGIVQDVKYKAITGPSPLPDPTARQKWKVIPTGEPFTYLITNQNHLDMALQAIHTNSGSGEPIRLMALNGADDQKWVIDLLKNFIE